MNILLKIIKSQKFHVIPIDPFRLLWMLVLVFFIPVAVAGCGGVGGDSNDGNDDDHVPPPRNYGAVAWNLNNSDCSYSAAISWNASTLEDALRVAVNDCVENRGSQEECSRDSGTFHNCAAIAYGKSLNRCSIQLAEGPSLDAARSNALAKCRDHLQGRCEIGLSACNNGGRVGSDSVFVSPPPHDSSFDIELTFRTPVTTYQKTVFRQAAQKWESIITADIPDVRINDQGIDRMVDDLLIIVDIVEIDGPGGTLALAGPEQIRETSYLPISGVMEFDIDDVGDNLYQTVLHEIGHVLGFGTIWDDKGLLGDPSLNADDEPVFPVPDTHFTGPLAIAAFDAAGGTEYTGKKVPVENKGGDGTQDGHWRESVFGNEIMSPFASDRDEPLSVITIQSLADIGYTVDVSQADPYRLPPPGSAARRTPGRHIHLGNDIRRGPIKVIDTNGRVVHIIE